MDTSKLNMINYIEKVKDELYQDAFRSDPTGQYRYSRQLDIIAEYLKNNIKVADNVYYDVKEKLNYRYKLEFLWDYQQHFNSYYKLDFEKIDRYDDLCK